MITSLNLKDFRRHSSLFLRFDDGMNGLFGANYAGKTSVLLAIAVALGGAGVAARGWRLVRRGASNFEIQMGLQIDGENYLILRTSSGAKLWRDEKLLATGHGAVNAELGELIGTPVDQWLELRFVRQKAAAAMFEAGAAKLNALVEDLTGVTTISRVIQALQTKQTKVEGLAETLQGRAMPDDWFEVERKSLAETQASLAELGTDDAALEQALQAVAEGLKHREAEQAEAEAELKQVQADHEKAVRAETRFEAAAARRAKYPATVRPAAVVQAELDSARTDLGDWQKWVSDMQAAQRALQRAQAALGKHEAVDQITLTELCEGITAATAQREQHAQALQDLELNVRSIRQSAKDLGQRIKEAHRQLEEGVCRTCRRPFDDQSDAHRAEAEEALAKLREELAKKESEEVEAQRKGEPLTQKLRELDKQLLALTSQRSAAERAMAERGAAERQVAEAEQQLQELQAAAEGATLEQGQQQVVELEQLVNSRRDELRLTEEVVELDAELDRLRLEVEQHKAADVLAQKIKGLTAQVEELREKVGALRSEKQGLQAKLEMNQSVRARLRQSLQHTEQRLEQAEKDREELNQLRSRLLAGTELIKYLRGRRSHYLAAAWEMIVARASTFAAAVTNNAISGLLRTEQGQFLFMEGAEEAGVDEASGAQAAILGLGVQIALAETLPTRLDLLLVDEPTADMDADHSAATVLALSTCAKQVVAISHHRMDESLCSQVNEL